MQRNFSHILADSTWSYSRITCFESCPYKFFLNYIKVKEGKEMFFANYGSFMHHILEQYLRGNLKRQELPLYYLSNFQQSVIGKPPNNKVFKTYFENGLQYLENPSNLDGILSLAVEERIDFMVSEKPFTGFIDLIYENESDGLTIMDHKSKILKPRSKKGNTKTDEELDSYLRQPYLYAIRVKEIYGRYPQTLAFNSFRSGTTIKEPFREEILAQTVKWASEQAETIIHNQNWKPKIEYFKCKYLCEHNHNCEYYRLYGGGK